MAKQDFLSNPGRGPDAGYPGRIDSAGYDERPFGEIRKNFQEFVRIISLHRWAFFVPFCLVASAASLLSLKYPRSYRATTSLERRNDPVMVDMPNSAATASFNYFRSTMQHDLTSVQCMAEVVERLGLIQGLSRNADGSFTKESIRRRNALARRLGSMVTIDTQSPGPNVETIALTYTGPDPTIGVKLLNELKKTYISRSREWVHDFLVSQQEYYLKEVRDAREELKLAERGETRWRMSNPHVNIENPGLLTSQLEELDLRRRELLLRLREHESRLSTLHQMLLRDDRIMRNASAQGVGSQASVKSAYVTPQVLHLMGELKEIDDRIKELRQSRGMTDEHPEIQVLRTSRAALTEDLNRQREQDRKVTIDDTKSPASQMEEGDRLVLGVGEEVGSRFDKEIASENAKLKDIEIRLQSNELAVKRLREAQKTIYQRQEEFIDVRTEVSKAKQHHRLLVAALSRIEPNIKALEQGRMVQFAEGDPARGSSIPVNPKAPTILLLAILAGVAAGTVFVILAEVLDHVYRSSTEVSRSLGLPILDTIDEIVTSQDRRRRLICQTVLSPFIVICFITITGFTGTMAYLSIRQPSVYHQLQQIPRAATKVLFEPKEPAVSAMRVEADVH